MTPICKAITKDAPHAYMPRVAHPCKNAEWHDGFCRVHHPVRRLKRLHGTRAALQKSLAKIEAEITTVESTGFTVTDIPGQLRMFDHQQPAPGPYLFATA